MSKTEYTKQAEEVKKNGILCANMISQLPGTFSDSIAKLMDMLGFTADKLCEASQLSMRTIQRIRNDRNYNPPYKTLVALCIGMNLPPALSSQLISRSGVRPMAGNYIDACYENILCTAWNKSIYEVNEILKCAGLPPLTKKE